MTTLILREEAKARSFGRIIDILEKYQYKKTRLITILQKIQEEYRYLPQEVLTYVATALDMPIAEVYGVATFYAHFSLKAKGKYVVKVCNGTACHVKGSMPLIDELYKKLNLSKSKHTTDDMMFTLETVSCLGACGLAPVMVINEKIYGEVSESSITKIIDELLEKEGE